ncbi:MULTISPECIES: 16S rRNA (guanine(1207)-N(2))-methyltransferase RsmC [Vibrio]|uniref:Ribosomal RNA small subunit methyltransferase C n=3 Tax=Vibrio TaxID=662 RepID=A0A2N7NIC7_9VIBR|nr:MULTISPECIES: 16S rRNA (guanine(1207)-N(2))-methyltransferase RsmC [Vibrio]EAQ52224.1 16S RNA G1207 methylase RsmC [Vibrio sp. MED222]PMP14666.1 16S rRNA methyltransferase [Vibrio tasmaniensis]TKG36185.1 16S rRNA (guanine(1207)-N(2))-methyltransferase RsmC [Vibrio tasmaniensis]TKG42495.1 16S rRNA (guanine(1207)-N(2))-methyltransferase RsmC [Vibrio tasmaniensis]TKG44137.1 16S rRNA (guanine(1207)-N(2))-methyltransferase RsmC [Vibrio tasmaniensis]
MSAYIAPSQIAQRQLAYFEGKHVLVAGEAEDLFPVELAKHCESVTVFTSNYSYYRQLEGCSTIQRFYGAEFTEETKADLVMLYWPKAKAEAEFLLAMLFAKLGKDTEIVVVGENRSGVKSIEKMFAPYGKVVKYDSARRCSFYWGQCFEQPPAFNLQDWFKTYTVNIGEQSLTVKSLPGVFSHGQFDVGSQLLLDTLPKLKGKVLDFGCGAGVLGAVMASRHPDIELEMCDISAFAVASSQATLEANGLTGNVFASDVYSDTSKDYQFIISNPPFHSGLDTSYSATETLLAQAPNHMKRSGEMIIVANSFLKYIPIIEQAFGKCATLNKTTKFAIYHASK